MMMIHGSVSAQAVESNTEITVKAKLSIVEQFYEIEQPLQYVLYIYT